MKHKHAELIKAWADGAEIQVKACNLVWEDRENPYWATDREYRIKPDPRPDEYVFIKLTIGDGNVYRGYSVNTGGKYDSNIKATIDGETGKLKKLEILE